MADMFSLNASRMRLTGIALPLAVLLASCAAPTVQDDSSRSTLQQPRIEREDVEFALDKGVASVVVDNPFGDIHVRDHDKAEVGVHGVIQRLAPDFAPVKVVSSRQGREMHLTVTMPGGKSASRYDMAVYVPADMAMSVRSTTHRVVARKRRGPLAITTSSGDIEATSYSRLDLSTESGMIRAAQLVERWPGTSHLQSKSGRIIALVPLSGDVSITAQTGGKLSTDFGLSVHPRAAGGFEAAARYGSGASELRIDSVSGEIVIDQSFILVDDQGSADDDD